MKLPKLQIQTAEKILNRKFSGANGHLVYCPNDCSVLSAYIDKIDIKKCKSANDVVTKISTVIMVNNLHKIL